MRKDEILKERIEAESKLADIEFKRLEKTRLDIDSKRVINEQISELRMLLAESNFAHGVSNPLKEFDLKPILSPSEIAKVKTKLFQLIHKL